jgi:pimeloyl-ACP methyl ester carboxylesterase
MTHLVRSALLVVLLVVVLAPAAGAQPPSGAAQEGRRSLTGALDGVPFRVELPERWNGTLVLHSHGYLPEGFPDLGIALTNRGPGTSESERWLLDHGYALAASQFREGGTGFQVANALEDQTALLDWFAREVGPPRSTIATGQSMGAAIALLLAERHPQRIAGVATVCGGPDPLGTFDAVLDVHVAVRALLAPGEDIDLVLARDPAASTQALVRAIERALRTPQGRARLALAAAFNNVPGWYSAHAPRPTDLAEWIRQQAAWMTYAYTYGLGPVARADVERRAGGNPLGNVGVDPRRQLRRSGQTALVRRAYREAGLDLRADLAAIAREPRIAADPEARAWMLRHVPTGRLHVPVVTLHTTGDGGAVPDQERWLARQVRRSGDPALLRQLWVDRGMHCSVSAAEELTALRSLLGRVATGRWPATDPGSLNAAARGLGGGLDLVLDLGTFQDAPMPPAFARFLAPRPMRPSR